MLGGIAGRQGGVGYEEALEDSDLVLVSGGSSAGTRDATADIINDLSRPGVLVTAFSIKPGKHHYEGSVRENR